MQSLNSHAGSNLFRQSTQRRMTVEQIGDLDTAADLGNADEIQTVMWTRELAKRLLLPMADVEALEDLLDTYFMQAECSESHFNGLQKHLNAALISDVLLSLGRPWQEALQLPFKHHSLFIPFILEFPRQCRLRVEAYRHVVAGGCSLESGEGIEGAD